MAVQVFFPGPGVLGVFGPRFRSSREIWGPRCKDWTPESLTQHSRGFENPGGSLKLEAL